MSSFLEVLMSIPQIDLVSEGFTVSIQLMKPAIRVVIYDQDDHQMVFHKLFPSETTLTEFAFFLDEKLQEVTNEAYEKRQLAIDKSFNPTDGF